MKKGITEKKKSKKYKLWYRILAYVGVILILFTACSLPISAVIDVSRGEGSDYNITANSSFPMDIGFTYRSSPDSTYNYTLMTSLGGFGQEWNRTSYGEDVVFYMYDELGNAVEVERGIAYTYGDVEWTTEEAFISHMMGNRLGYQPIHIGSTTPSSPTDEQPVTTIVLKASDIVYNTAWTDWYRITRDSLDPPTIEELAYMGIPTITAPHVIDPFTERFIGRLNINYDIVDCYGNVKNSNYSVEIDTQLRDDPIPLISLDDLLEYDIVQNPRLLISNYSAWWDVDYYTKTADVSVTLEGGEYEGVISIPDFSDIPYVRYNMPFVSNGQSFDGFEVDSGVVNYYTQDAITQDITNRVTAITNGSWVDGYQNIELAHNYIVYEEFGYVFNYIFTRIEETVVTDSLRGVWVFDADIRTALKTYAGTPSKLFYIDFTSNGQEFDTLGLYRPSASGSDVNMKYAMLRGSSLSILGAFYYDSNTPPEWTSGQEYRTIIISTTLANVGNASGSELLNFLNACATKTSDDIDGEESYTTVNTTSDRTNESQFAVWVKDSNSDLKNSVNLTIPLYDTSGAIMSDEAAVAAQIIYWSFPNALSFVRNSSSISFDDLSWTDWLVNSISGFINFEIVPGLSFGGLIGILVTFSVVLIFLKVFAGG